MTASTPWEVDVVRLTRCILALALVVGGCETDDTPADGTTGPETADVADVSDGSDVAAEIDTGPAPRADLAWPVDAPGPYNIGHRTIEVTHTPPGHDGPRTLLVRIWYPTNDTEGPASSYHLPIFEYPEAFDGASLAPPAEPTGYPVHMHSHGHQGYSGSSPHVMHHFATHGWVVVAPDHTGNTLTDLLSPRPAWMYYVRSLDISAVMDHLEDLPQDDPLAGKLRLDRVVMSGHSYGGYTTFASAGASYDMDAIGDACDGLGGPLDPPCTQDQLDVFAAGVREPRVVAAFPMAAGNREMFGDAGFATIAVPVLQMSGTQDTAVTNASQSDPIWAALQGVDAIRVDIAGGCHHTFSLGGCPDIDDAVSLPIVNTYGLAFARHHVLADDTPNTLGLLEGSIPVSATVTFSATPSH